MKTIKKRDVESAQSLYVSRPFRSTAFSLVPLIAAGLIGSTDVHARPPVTSPAPNALPQPSSGVRPFVYSGSGFATTTGNNMVVNQSTRTLGLNWDRFNIGSNASVTFNQPDATSRVLNRIWSTDPSVILGRLTANGQVYLINQNGILFGAGSEVNVGGLVASALSVSEDLLAKGLPQTKGETLRFDWGGNAEEFNDSFVAVDAGARITTPSGSRVVLLAPKTAENFGLIRSGAGAETILAAGGSVVLTAPEDPNLRGLLVQTQSFKGKDSLGNDVVLDGTAANRLGGTIQSSGGVVSLAALSVNQEGMVNATKAINLNGSVILVSGTNTTSRTTINQRGKKAEIDWKSGFNINESQTVEFVQESAGDVAYNFVYDPDRILSDGSPLNVAGSSTINGQLKANGQLFLINERGINFGSQANVTASNFVASALGINPTVVASGLFSQDGVSARAFYLTKNQWVAARTGDFAATRDQALAAFRQSTVNVSAGARITTSKNGFAILAGGKVNQGGTITTPNGQTLLAAGADVYLKPPYSQLLRGFTAEVNPLYVVQSWMGNGLWSAVSRGADANAVTNTGSVTSVFGNITLVGNQVTQAGVLTTSTSVTQNGSIKLLARDQVTSEGYTLGLLGEPRIFPQPRVRDKTTGQIIVTGTSTTNQTEPENFIVGTVGGTLTLTKGSKTEVVLDGSDNKTIAADQRFQASSIEGAAAKINVEGRGAGLSGAQLLAKGGNISLTALGSFDVENNLFPQDPVSPDRIASSNPNVGVFIGAGATLDASGAIAQKSVADLFKKVELRGDEFASNPIQRRGKLRGETAWVDIRDKVGIADLAGYFGKVEQTLEERAATGGTIAIRSSGSVIVKPDAVLNVSGGRVDYAEGVVTESMAVTRGGIAYRLSNAPVDYVYTGLATRERRERAYTEGKSAGTVELTGNNIVLGGTLLGNTVRGERQRNLGDPSKDRFAVPYGAKLVIRDGGQHYQPTGASDAEKASAYGKAQIAFVTGRSTLADALSFGDSAGPRLELSQSLVDAGFSRFDIKSDGRIDVPDGVSLNIGAGGEFKASGRQVFVGGDITVPQGKITLETSDVSQVSPAHPQEAKYSTLIVDSGATLSTAGRWINDFLVTNPADFQPIAVHGGSVSLNSAYDIQLRNGSHIDVSGGGRAKSDGKLESGNAGKITLKTGGLSESTSYFNNSTWDWQTRRDSSLFLDGTLSGYALGKGGSLEIETSKIRFGVPFAQDSRNWSRAQRLAADQVGAAFTADFLNRGGFFDFKFTGRDGLTVANGVTLAPKPISWTLTNTQNYRRDTSATPSSSLSAHLVGKTSDAYRYIASGLPISSFAKSEHLSADLRKSPTSLKLATSGVAYGDLNIGIAAYLQVDPQGSIELESWRQLTVLGTLEALAGQIRLIRPLGISDLNAKATGYTQDLQSRSIYLGPTSRLLAGGTSRVDASTRAYLDAGFSPERIRRLRLYRGDVLPAGRVELDAGLGYLITRPGSLIDVSGASDLFNNAHKANGRLSYATQLAGGAGGSVKLSARDGMFLDGSYQAKGGAGALNGVFSMKLADISNNSNAWNLASTAVSPEYDALLGARQVTLFQSVGSHPTQWPNAVPTNDYLTGSALLDPVQYNGKARLDLTPLAEAGFGSWYLKSENTMIFEGSIRAAVQNQLRLDSPIFIAQSNATNVSLSAAAIQLGSYSAIDATPPTMGTARFVTNTRDLALVGNFSWGGFGVSNFASRGELHFDGVSSSDGPINKFGGQLTGTGAVAFSAARLSPSTFSDFKVDLSADTASQISITRPANSEVLGPLLSAAGRLTFNANTIVHRGTIEAPLGQVIFNSPSGSVTLGSGSITSVAASSSLLLGHTSQSGKTWEYMGVDLKAPDKAPEKLVKVDAAHSVLETSARIDLSSGGDAIAWEFSPGPGGKVDVLAPTAGKDPTIFAILPGTSGNFAPADRENQAGYNVSVQLNGVEDSVPSLKPGDQIQLAQNPTGVWGTFTLLPARYALMPGAMLVSIKPAQENTVARSVAQADGSWLVSASRLAANVDGTYSAYSSRPLTVEVAPQAVVFDRARYILTSANGFFYDTAAQLPGDVGRLSVAGRQSLVFDPVVLGRRTQLVQDGKGNERAGRGLALDLAASKIEVIDAGTTSMGAGWTTLNKATLNAMGASSLVLGGVRSVNGGTTTIDTISTQVRVATSGNNIANDALQGSELLFVASEDVTFAAGSLLAANNTTGTLPAQHIVLTGDGAFARVAGGEQASLERQGTVTNPQGNFRLEAGATVTGKALIFDATNNNTLAGTVGQNNVGQIAATGGALAIGAKRINVVGDGSTPTEGFKIDNAKLAGFGNLNQLRLNSYTTLDLYGPAQLGTGNINELVIAAAGIAGHGVGAATLQGTSIRFENPNATTASFTPGAPLGGGSLAVSAQNITFGANTNDAMRTAGTTGFGLRGFTDVTMTASREVRFEGLGVTEINNTGGSGAPAKLTIDAGRVVAASGSDHLVKVSGAGEIKGGANTAGVADLGGRMDFRADSVDVAGRIVAPAGSIALTATGSGKHVTLKNGSVVNAHGVAVAFDDIWAYAPGGKIVLKSEAGNVDVQTGATVSLSGGPGGDAGRLELIAQTGTVSVAEGTLHATANANDKDLRQGELTVDANNLNANQLAAAARNNFSGLWDIRQRNGNILLTDSVKAQKVRFAADNGNIQIGDGTQLGKIDASGAKGGEIELYSRNGTVTLSSTAQLLAKSEERIDNTANAGTRGRGGRVTLGGTGTGSKVITQVGSLIDVGVALDSLAQGGKVVFRAPESTVITNKTDLNIQLAGSIQGASDVSAEIVKNYTGTSLSTGNTSVQTLGLTTIQNDLTAKYSAPNMTTLRNHLGFGTLLANPTLHIRPGVEITTPAASTSDFTISANLQLNLVSNLLRFQDEAGVLTIRAPRDLNITNSISDGFNGLTTAATLNNSGDSWSYRLVAGADRTAANPLAVVAPPATTGSNPLGLKGSINVSTGKLVRTGTGDIALAARRNINLNAAAIYTAGYVDINHPANFFGIFATFYPTNGGNVSLVAGENILSTGTPKHVNTWLLRLSNAGGGFFNTQWWSKISAFTQGVAAFGGGDIQVLAGTDINNVTAAIPTNGRVPGIVGQEQQVALAKIQGGGDLTVRAHGSVVGGLFYAETGRMRIEAGKSVESSSTSPSTVTTIALGNTNVRVNADKSVSLGNVFNPMWVEPVANSVAPHNTMLMGTYGDQTSLNVVSLTGSAAFNTRANIFGASDPMQLIAPSKIKIAALQGDIDVGRSGALYQAPSPNAQLDLLAGKGISVGVGSIKQLDLPLSLLSSIGTPLRKIDLTKSSQHAESLWHQNDFEPSRLIALSGDISGSGGEDTSYFNEALHVSASGDVKDFGFTAQHVRRSDVTRVSAGKDVKFSGDKGKFQVNGLGALEVLAGHNVDLGGANGIITRGNLENFYLPEGGASVYVLAGGKPDYASFRRFLGVGDEVSEASLRDRFYGELRDKGREAVAGGGAASYAKGGAAIKALFPAGTVTGGNIDFFNSQIKTEQGGGIDLMVPGGSVTVGIANPPVNAKVAAEQGLFTITDGDIRAFVRDDFLVNQSRVFTLDGGDILVWADRGTIDAGSGAKTVGSTPPPTLIIRDGLIVLDTSNSISGSGIGALESKDDTPASDLDLFAPNGNIDAGDAGLRSSGKINLGALKILNASNIQAAGGVAGAPAAAPAAVPTAAPSNPANTKKEEGDAQAASRLQQGLITVEVLGNVDDGAASSAPNAPSAPNATDSSSANTPNTSRTSNPFRSPSVTSPAATTVPSALEEEEAKKRKKK